MPRNETSHFFLGRFPSEQVFIKFLKEAYPTLDDDVPVSPFYDSQGETFCDHDFMESGFRDQEPTLKDFFEQYSYAEYWADELSSRATKLGLDNANALIFISKNQITSPSSVKEEEYSLSYLGEIEYPI